MQNQISVLVPDRIISLPIKLSAVATGSDDLNNGSL
jgi:hypothetical protein